MCKEKKTFTLYLTSGQKVSGNNYNATYNVNWYSFLPTKYKRFHLQAYFKTNPFSDTTNLTPTVPNAVVISNIPSPYTYSTLTNSRSSCIAIAHTHFFNMDYLDLNPNYYYLENSESAGLLTVAYPQNNNLTIQLTNFAGTELSTLIDSVNYSLILTFTPIDEKECGC